MSGNNDAGNKLYNNTIKKLQDSPGYVIQAATLVGAAVLSATLASLPKRFLDMIGTFGGLLTILFFNIILTNASVINKHNSTTYIVRALVTSLVVASIYAMFKQLMVFVDKTMTANEEAEAEKRLEEMKKASPVLVQPQKGVILTEV